MDAFMERWQYQQHIMDGTQLEYMIKINKRRLT